MTSGATFIVVSTVRRRLSRLVEEVAAGAEIVITRSGRPVARLAPLAEAPKRRRTLGLLAGEAVIPPAFDDPLPDDVFDALEGR